MLRETTKYLTWLTFPAKEDLAPSWRKVYMQCADRVFLPTHVRQPFTSYLVDLGLTEEELLANYSKKLRQNISRARKASFSIERDQNPSAVVELFRPIAATKGLNPIDSSKFVNKDNLLITRAVHPLHGVLAAHAYQYDPFPSRVLGVYNASAFRKYGNDKELQYLCGQANSLLYHEDLMYFSRLGYRVYDFGGYGGGADGVDYFKDRFGGTLVRQYNYFPIWYYLVRMIRNAHKKYGHGR